MLHQSQELPTDSFQPVISCRLSYTKQGSWVQQLAIALSKCRFAS